MPICLPAGLGFSRIQTIEYTTSYNSAWMGGTLSSTAACASMHSRHTGNFSVEGSSSLLTQPIDLSRSPQFSCESRIQPMPTGSFISTSASAPPVLHRRQFFVASYSKRYTCCPFLRMPICLPAGLGSSRIQTVEYTTSYSSAWMGGTSSSAAACASKNSRSTGNFSLEGSSFLPIIKRNSAHPAAILSNSLSATRCESGCSN